MNKTLLLTSASAFALVLAASAPAFAVDGAKAESISTVQNNTATDNQSKRDNLLQNAFNPATGIVHDQQNNGSNNSIGAATAVHADVTGGTPLDTGAIATSVTGGNSSDHIGDHDPDRRNRILNTMNGFVGSATLQQNNGDNNAINAATALDGVSGNTGAVSQQTLALQANNTHGGIGQPVLALDNASVRDNLINSSFTGASGVFTVQQNNGSGNGLTAATAALGVTGNADGLMQSVATRSPTFFNGAIGFDTERDNKITDSFNGASGVFTVQQNNGDGNSISSATGVAGIGGDAGPFQQFATTNSASAHVSNNKSFDTRGKRKNDIDPSFEGAHGVVTVQQNNGDNSGMAVSNVVAGHVGSAGNILQFMEVASVSLTADNKGVDIDSSRENIIPANNFNDASGVITVQQNNGNANMINAANTVAGIAGNTGTIEQDFRHGRTRAGSQRNDVRDKSSVRDNRIIDSFQRITGTVTVQQNNGNANSVHAGTGMIGVGGSSDNVLQKVDVGRVPTAGEFTGAEDNKAYADGEDRGNLIDPAFDSLKGIATVQQNNGDANNMAAFTAVIATNGAGTVGQDISAIHLSRGNTAEDHRGERDNRIVDSFNDLKGIVTVQQNNGDANSIVAATGVVFVNGEAGDTTQTISALGTSEDNGAGNTLRDLHGKRTNLIDPAFIHAEGILTVQQNNGSGNAMTALTGGIANRGGDDLDTTQNISAGGLVAGNLADNVFASFPDPAGRTNTVTDMSFHALTGIVTVQQNNGNGNVIGAATGVIANFGDGMMDDAKAQNVTTDNSVNHSRAKYGRDSASHGQRKNTLDGNVFNWSRGVVTVQQNNGDNNAISAATGVRAEIGATAGTNPDDEEVSTQLAKTVGSVTDSEAFDQNTQLHDAYDRHNLLTDAFKGGVNGVFTVQQNNGGNNAIGSATAVVADIDNVEDIDSALDNLARTEGTVSGNEGNEGNIWGYGSRNWRTKRMNTLDDGAFDFAAGIITVQQNNGDNNVMGAATGVVANVDTVKRFGKQVNADAEGDATVTGNTARSEHVDRLNVIDSAMNGVQGVVTVQQNNGDNNVLGAATTVVASTEMPGFGPAASTSTLGATVSGNASTVNGPLSEAWSNTVNDSFNGATGIMTVQQNNGNNNAMGSAIAAVANSVSFAFND